MSYKSRFKVKESLETLQSSYTKEKDPRVKLKIKSLIYCIYSGLSNVAANLKGIKGFWLFFMAVSHTVLNIA